MKPPNSADLQALGKAQVADPVIAGKAAPRRSYDAATATTKLTIRMDADLAGRIRAAWLAEAAAGANPGSLSAFAASILDDGIAELEARRNGGREYEPLGAGSLPSGPAAY